MGWRESADAIRAALTKSRRAKPAKSGKGAMSPLSLDRCPERELATTVGAGSPDGGRSAYRSIGEWSAESKLDPATGDRNCRIRDPYVRWCGRCAVRRTKSGDLRKSPRQSLANSREPSFAQWADYLYKMGTSTVKRKQGGNRP
jgi:hypothetical protein